MVTNGILTSSSQQYVEMESIPVELGFEVAKHLPCRDLKSLALASRYNLRIVQSILFADVDVPDSRLRSFHASVLSRPTYLGPLVRRLRFDHDSDEVGLAFDGLTELLRALPNLRCLHINVRYYFPRHYDRLSDAILAAPQLTHLETGSSMDPMWITNALRRMVNITELSLDLNLCRMDADDPAGRLQIFFDALDAMSAHLIRLSIRGPLNFRSPILLLKFTLCDILPRTPHVKELLVHETLEGAKRQRSIGFDYLSDVSLPTNLQEIKWIDRDALIYHNSPLIPDSTDPVRSLFALIPSVMGVDHYGQGYRYVYRRLENNTIERRSKRIDSRSLTKALEEFKCSHRVDRL